MGPRIVMIVASALICVSCIIAYVIYVQRGSGEAFEVIRLAALLFLAFFSLTFLMPLAGISIDASRNHAGQSSD